MVSEKFPADSWSQNEPKNSPTIQKLEKNST